jgi:hypothetical protein
VPRFPPRAVQPIGNSSLPRCRHRHARISRWLMTRRVRKSSSSAVLTGAAISRTPGPLMGRRGQRWTPQLHPPPAQMLKWLTTIGRGKSCSSAATMDRRTSATPGSGMASPRPGWRLRPRILPRRSPGRWFSPISTAGLMCLAGFPVISTRTRCGNGAVRIGGSCIPRSCPMRVRLQVSEWIIGRSRSCFMVGWPT